MQSVVFLSATLLRCGVFSLLFFGSFDQQTGMQSAQHSFYYNNRCFGYTRTVAILCSLWRHSAHASENKTVDKTKLFTMNRGFMSVIHRPCWYGSMARISEIFGIDESFFRIFVDLSDLANFYKILISRIIRSN